MVTRLSRFLFAAALSASAFNASAQSISITSSADTICSGSSVHYTASATGVGTPHYQWLKNSVNVGTDSFGFTTSALSSGDVIMCVLYSTAGGSVLAFSNPKVATVYSLPSTLTISGPSSVCRTATISLSPSGTGGVWSVAPPGVVTVSVGGTVTGTNAGTVNISYTISNFCGSITATHPVTVNTVPAVPAIQGSVNICVGGSGSTLTDSLSGGVWSSSNTSVATISSTGGVTPIAVGSTTITYAVTNTCGTTNRTRVLNVIAAPAPAPITGRLVICEGDTAQLRTGANGGTWSTAGTAVATIAISGGGPGGGGQFGVVTGINGGTTTVSYVLTNACGSNTNTAIVTVNPLPVVYPITGADSICQGGSAALGQASTGGVWSSSNTAVATVSSAGTVTGVASGSAVITYSSTNDCGTTIQTKTVFIACPHNVGVASFGEQAMVIAPNPATDVVTIQGYQPAAITVVNTMGQVVAQVTGTNSINLAHVPAGVYIICLYSADGAVANAQRIIKQ